MIDGISVNNGIEGIIDNLRSLYRIVSGTYKFVLDMDRVRAQIGEDIDCLIRLQRSIKTATATKLPDDTVLNCTSPSEVIRRIEQAWHNGRSEGEKATVEKFKNGTFSI